MFAPLARSHASWRWELAEPADPERFIWPEDLDPSDATVTDEDLYGHEDAWLAFVAGLGADDVPGPANASLFADMAPGADLAHCCESAFAMVDELHDGDLLDLVDAAERMSRWADGLRTRAIARYADRHPAGTSAIPPGGSIASPVARWVPDELGMTLHVSRLEAQSLLASAQRLAHVLPDTLDALQAGRIDERRADTISFATRTLPDEKARTVEASVLAKADGATYRQVYDRTRRAVHRVDPDGEHRRHQVARTERRVTMQPREEGMASLWAFGPAEQCEATFTMLTRLARSLGPTDPRTLDQRRFDLMGQLVQGRLTATDLTDIETLLAVARDSLADEAANAGADSARGVDEESAGVSGPAAAGAGDNRARGQRAPDGTAADGGAADGGATDGGTTDGNAVDGNAADGNAGWSNVDEIGSGRELVAIVAAALARQPRAADIVRRPLVQVVVGIDTLLGSDRPGELIGHGPIPATTARALAAGGSLARMVVDSLSGTLLDYGRTIYAPPAGLADFVRARDQVCRGPGCSRRVNELDHRQRWDGLGHTSDVNLDGYCRSCHVLKELDDWHVLADGDGRLTWISPAGRLHTTEPYDYRPFIDDFSACDVLADDRSGDDDLPADDNHGAAAGDGNADEPDEERPPF